jgi:protein TonB
MNFHNRQDAILAGFVTLSLLLHILLLNLFPEGELLLAPREKTPVYVEVRPPQLRDRELDLPVQPDQERPRETPAKRLGPADGTVPKETAPKGDAPEDRLASLPAVPLPEPRPPMTPSEQGETARREPLDPSKLNLDLPRTTVDRYRQEWRRKYRQDVEEGDAVWLDTERDILLSFFQRFRRNIYNVWNYPPLAAERGERGTCLLKITINRDGSVDGVELMESSGSATLDREAIASVYRGASYGDLPSAYEGKNLNIMAFFQYKLTYGNPGDRAIY